MVVMVYGYTGLLTSLLTVPKFEPIITRLEELASSNRFRVTRDYNTELTNRFLVKALL